MEGGALHRLAKLCICHQPPSRSPCATHLVPDHRWRLYLPADPSSSTYASWGNSTSRDGSVVPEPNQLLGVENCAVGNSSTMVKKKWGWADTECNAQFVSICKFQRESCCGQQCCRAVSHALLSGQLPCSRLTVNSSVMLWVVSLLQGLWYGVLSHLLSHYHSPSPHEGYRHHPHPPTLLLIPRAHQPSPPPPSPPPPCRAAPRVFYYYRNLSAAGDGTTSRRRLQQLDSSVGLGADLALEDATSPASAPGRELLQDSNEVTSDTDLPMATYILNQRYMTQVNAEKYCVDQGGHLVGYLNLEEQVGAGGWWAALGDCAESADVGEWGW
jgi:hypothetical protein